jgi:hypothetical protein
VTEADKQKLIAEIIGVPTNFELSLSDEGRRWFVDRLIRSLETGTPPTPDAGIPAKVRAVVGATKTIATAKAAIKLKIPLETSHKGWHGTTHPRRIEVIYGAIAADPSLADAANDKQLDLVIRRRYRSIARMELWVNGGGATPLFQYPDDTCTALRINASAVPLWNVATPHSDSSGRTLPRWTIKTAAASVVPAVEKLWDAPGAACQGNVLECATAMSTVLMDSLLESRDSNVLLRALHARGPQYLAICNPTLGDAVPNFVLDGDARRVFDTRHIAMDDLQVGDYVYVWNHALYPVFKPFGAWSGEHALVVAARTRDQLNGFRVSGHGVGPKTIAMLHAELLALLQSVQDALYVVGSQFLEFLEAGTSEPDVTFDQRQFMIRGQLRDTHFYLFDRPFTFTNYTVNPVAPETQPRFLIVYVPDIQEFGLHRSQVMAEAVVSPFNVIPVVQFRSVDPAEQFDPVNWGIPYTDHLSTTEDVWPLFRRDNGELGVNLVRERDMPNPPLAREVGQSGVRITQPMHRPTPAGAI